MVSLEVIDPGSPPAIRLRACVDERYPGWQVLRDRVGRHSALCTRDIRPVPGNTEENSATIGGPMQVLHPAFDRRRGAAFSGFGIEQMKLEVTGLAAIGKE